MILGEKIASAMAFICHSQPSGFDINMLVSEPTARG